MQRLSGQLIAPRLQALLKGGALTGEWVIDSRKSSLRLKTGPCWGLPSLQGVFRELRGNGTRHQPARVLRCCCIHPRRRRGLARRRGPHQSRRLRPHLESDGKASMDNTLTIYAAFTQR